MKELHNKAAPRTPPSQRVFLTPLSGQFDAALMLNPLAGPPLSVVNTIILFFNKPLDFNAETTFPTDSSNFDKTPNNINYFNYNIL